MRTLARLGLAVAVLLASGCSATSDEGANVERQEREQARAQERAATAPPPDRTLPEPAGRIWISRAALMRLPTSGAAWQRLKAAADGLMQPRDIAGQDSNHDVKTLAVALVAARPATRASANGRRRRSRPPSAPGRGGLRRCTALHAVL